MRVYVYQAALLCEACGVAAREALTAEGHGVPDANDESSYDSGDYPKGPYDSRDSESDSPDHCDHCHEFLETRLTPDGAAYVLDAVAEFDYLKRGKADVIALWREFYKDEINDASERRACADHSGKRNADHVDGYDRDDIGESHD